MRMKWFVARIVIEGYRYRVVSVVRVNRKKRWLIGGRLFFHLNSDRFFCQSQSVRKILAQLRHRRGLFVRLTDITSTLGRETKFTIVESKNLSIIEGMLPSETLDCKEYLLSTPVLKS